MTSQMPNRTFKNQKFAHSWTREDFFFAQLVPDVRALSRFKNVLIWADSMSQYETAANVKILVGNKCDRSEERAVSTAQGEELASKLGCRFYETSAKTSINCEDAFLNVANECFDKGLYITPNGQPLKLDPTPAPTESSQCPC